MRTQEVVYVPVPENREERDYDVAVRRTIEMLCQNQFVLQGKTRLKDEFGLVIYIECWVKRL